MSNEPATTPPVISTFASSPSASTYVFSQSNVSRSGEPEDTPANQATFEDCNAHYEKMRQVTLLKKKITFLKRMNLSLASFTNKLKLKLKCAKERIKKKNVCEHCEKEKMVDDKQLRGNDDLSLSCDY